MYIYAIYFCVVSEKLTKCRQCHLQVDLLKLTCTVLILHSLEDHVICVDSFAILAYSIDTILCPNRQCNVVTNSIRHCKNAFLTK